MKSIWTGQFDNNEIKVENSWFHGERLYINNLLQELMASPEQSLDTSSIKTELS